MEEILKEILTKLNSLDIKVSNIEANFSTMEANFSTMETGQKRIEKKLDGIYDHTADLTEFKTSTNENITEIRKDVGFIKHKLHQNEEEIFDIKSYIKLAK